MLYTHTQFHVDDMNALPTLQRTLPFVRFANIRHLHITHQIVLGYWPIARRMEGESPGEPSHWVPGWRAVLQLPQLQSLEVSLGCRPSVRQLEGWEEWLELFIWYLERPRGLPRFVVKVAWWPDADEGSELSEMMWRQWDWIPLAPFVLVGSDYKWES